MVKFREKGKKMGNYIFSNAVVGQKIWTIHHGDAEIIEIDYSSEYPITAASNNTLIETYDLSGKFTKIDVAPSAFLTKPDFFKEKEKNTSVKRSYFFADNCLCGHSNCGIGSLCPNCGRLYAKGEAYIEEWNDE